MFSHDVARIILAGRLVHGSRRDLKQYVRFSTVVRRVEYNTDTDDFTVTAKNLKEDKEEVERFSHVVVATGMFSTPNHPDAPGIKNIKGRVLHSKQVKHLNEFKGQRVLVIGSFLSAEDLAVMLMKFGAKSVIIAYKYRPFGHKWPAGIEERHFAVKFDENKAQFQDGSTSEIDVVMFCTGYKLEFPFMSEDLRLNTDTIFYPENLFEGVLWLKGGNNKLMYIGMHYNVFQFITYEYQAIWAFQNIMGSVELPSKEEMSADSEKWVEKARDAAKNHYFPETFEFIKQYFRHMVETVGYPTVVMKLQNVFHKMFEDMAEDICTWRDKQFDCIYTGNTCPAPIVPWMDDYDDSLERFVKQYWTTSNLKGHIMTRHYMWSQ